MPQRTDLTVEAFRVLRQSFFDKRCRPKPFLLRDKLNTQDDPFDEHVHGLLSRKIKRAQCVRAPGPLITPDIVLFRPDFCEHRKQSTLRGDVSRIVGLEVKKIERGKTGVARASGMDYNTTPPCGTIRVYDNGAQPLDIRGFYLFVCQEPVERRAQTYRLTALALCDGNILNEDFDLYLSIVGERRKTIGLGTYADGVDRNRPMLIFSNPLGFAELDHAVTLVHGSGRLADEFSDLRLVHKLTRTGERGKHTFYCYRKKSDVPTGWRVQAFTDPFPTPSRRSTATQRRGRFRLPIEPV